MITGESVKAGFSGFLFLSDNEHPCCLGKPVSTKMFVLMHLHVMTCFLVGTKIGI